MTGWPSADDRSPHGGLHDLDRRTDARFQAVNARFSTIDRHLSKIGDRLDEQDHRAVCASGRVDARFRWLEHRFDATDARMDLFQEKVAAPFRRERHDRHRVMLLAAVISAASWALTVSLLLITR